MAEVAIVLPVMLLVLLAIFKFGLMYANYLTLTSSVRTGARQLALGRGASDPCGQAVLALLASANSASGKSLNLTAAQVTITFPDPSGIDTCGVGDPVNGYAPNTADLVQGHQETVSATYPCDLSLLGMNFFSGCTLTAAASEAVE